jgi:broad specificity phosphatase PhoE
MSSVSSDQQSTGHNGFKNNSFLLKYPTKTKINPKKYKLNQQNKIMRLYLVRHGETHHNKKDICQGHYNSQLTKKGIKQAKAVAKRLKNEKINFIYSSDLDRTKNTTKEILKFYKKIKPVFRKDLREQSKGIFENKPHLVIRTHLKDNKIKKWHEYKPQGGESLKEVYKKMIQFYNEIRKKHPKENILMVGHGGPIACLIAYLKKEKVSSTDKYKIKSTAVTTIEINEKNKIKFIAINCSKHTE